MSNYSFKHCSSQPVSCLTYYLPLAVYRDVIIHGRRLFTSTTEAKNCIITQLNLLHTACYIQQLPELEGQIMSNKYITREDIYLQSGGGCHSPSQIS